MSSNFYMNYSFYIIFQQIKNNQLSMKQIINFLDHLLATLQSEMQKNPQEQDKNQNRSSLSVCQGTKTRKNKHKMISKMQLRAHCYSKLSRRGRQEKRNQYNEVISMCESRVNEDVSKKMIKKKFQQYLLQGNNEDLFCSVCKNQFLTPAITQCSHIFCLQCIQRSLKYSIKCPLCRHQITTSDHYGLNLLQSIEKLSKKVLQYKNKDSYLKKIEIHHQWKDSRFLRDQKIKQKEMIDVWDLSSHKWKRAEILNIFNDEDPKSIMIEYSHGDKQRQIIQLPSLRIANYKFYSSQEPSPHEDRFGFNFFLLSSSALRHDYHHERHSLRSANENLIQVYTRLRQDRQRQRRLRRQERQRQRDQTRQRLRVLRRIQMQNDRQQNLDWLMQSRRPRMQLMIQRQPSNQQQIPFHQAPSRNNSPFYLRADSLQYIVSAYQSSEPNLNIENINEIQQIIDPPNNLQNLRPDNLEQPIQNDYMEQNLPNLNPNSPNIEMIDLYHPQIDEQFESQDVIFDRS